MYNVGEGVTTKVVSILSPRRTRFLFSPMITIHRFVLPGECAEDEFMDARSHQSSSDDDEVEEDNNNTESVRQMAAGGKGAGVGTGVLPPIDESAGLQDMSRMFRM